MTTDSDIFKKGSTTYYLSSRFFPKKTRRDVAKLYSFVRIVDDYVDSSPQNVVAFEQTVTAWQKLVKKQKIPLKTDPLIVQVTKNMYAVATKYDFDFSWIDAFFASMRMDIDGRHYKTMDETLEYIYGSAEVIGLMMAKILKVKETAYESARLQGRAMQYINFIRDIAEDIELGRCYFPQTELAAYGLEELTPRVISRHRADYREFVEAQLAHYHAWQKEAAKGFKSVPRRQRIALRTAVDMYNWTALMLAHNPFIVFDKKVKPSKLRVVSRALIRSIHA